MTDFWNSILTDKSWEILTRLSKEKFQFIVIGGWAAYLWTKLHKSKDIDIALFQMEDLRWLRQHFTLKKNDRLKKYEISFEEIDVDVYVPFYSKLPIPIEDLKKYSTRLEGLSVVIPEALLILKQGAEFDRGASVKGVKDQIDIMTLLFFTKVNFKFYMHLLKRYEHENYFSRLKQIINTFTEYEYLNLNPREFKLKKKEILKRLKEA